MVRMHVASEMRHCLSAAQLIFDQCDETLTRDGIDDGDCDVYYMAYGRKLNLSSLSKWQAMMTSFHLFISIVVTSIDDIYKSITYINAPFFQLHSQNYDTFSPHIGSCTPSMLHLRFQITCAFYYKSFFLLNFS